MQMALFKYSVIGVILSLNFSEQLFAKDLEFGNPEGEYGELVVSGFLRAKYQDKSWTKNDRKLVFDAARLNLDYQKDKIFARAEYRCYQFDKLCDFSALVDGYVGYKITEKDNIKLGVQTIPFGPTRFWETSYYGGINTQYGLEDVHNLGVNYQFEPIKNTTIDLGFYPTDAGNYRGSTKDAARYTTNFVKPDDAKNTYLQEKNMWIGRIRQQLHFSDLPDLNASVGTSYWYSNIENKSNQQTGQRNAWSAFGTMEYNNLNLILVMGQNNLKNKDSINPYSSLAGSFDGNYWLANKGDFYTADVSYTFKNVGKLDSITPYAMHSSYIKDQPTFKNSIRNTVGVTFSHKSIMLQAEYIVSKNDLFVGGDEYALAQGSSPKTKKLLNFQLFYHF
ncbi:hypothetical protein KW868_15015 [Acinetobacter guillouiae]|uniref:Porin n=1 Tax=Acinetobacter guillouiae TaxID=106649 RepID=A0A8X8GGK5_ACIGI|nr:hypothetical protein [Acinetobacter guillouiae]